MKKITLILLLFIVFQQVTMAQDPSYSTLTLTKGYDQLKFETPTLNRYWIMSKPNDGKSFALYSPDDGGWFTYWKTGTGDMILDKGKIGIGTSSPSEKLSISEGSIFGFNSNGAFMKIKRTQGLPSIKGIYDGIAGFDGQVIIDGAGNSDAVYLNNYVAGNVLLTMGGGNVGIGTSTPSEKLTIKEGSVFGYNSSGAFLKIKRKIGQPSIKGVFDSSTGFDGKVVIDGAGNSDPVFLNNYVAGDVLLALGGGNVGIGTPSPDSKLSVNGGIRCKEVKVEAFNWPDFVFEDSYELRSLEETEHFIKINRHLPEIPDQEEAESNGIDLSEMNAKLLQKVEELTLYLIQQNKKLEKATKDIEGLQQEVSVLKDK